MKEVNARILLWGVEGAGKRTTLRTIHSKLRPDLRGELRTQPTRLDPTQSYDALAISLGEISGIPTRIEIVAVPGAPDQAMTRKQLLDEVDGIVIVLDASPERIDTNYAAIDELKASLAAYGRRLDAFPIVLQYNKRDIADPFAIEALHRRIGLDQAAVFETIATTGHGILATLTTISKHVVRARKAGAAQTSAADAPDAETLTERDAAAEARSRAATAPAHEVLEAAILAEGDGADPELADLESTTQPSWQASDPRDAKPTPGLGAELRVVSVGQAALEADGSIRLPLVIGDESGTTRSLTLTLRLEELAGGGDG
jgi:signal recognition particle receptor subunit beta